MRDAGECKCYFFTNLLKGCQKASWMYLTVQEEELPQPVPPAPHPLLPSSPYLLFIIPFLRDYILLAWDGATWTFHIPSEFLRIGQVTRAFLVTGNMQPSFISCTLKVHSSFSSVGLFTHATNLPPAPRES